MKTCFAQAIPYLLARRPLGYLLFIMELAGLDRLFFFGKNHCIAKKPPVRDKSFCSRRCM